MKRSGAKIRIRAMPMLLSASSATATSTAAGAIRFTRGTACRVHFSTFRLLNSFCSQTKMRRIQLSSRFFLPTRSELEGRSLGRVGCVLSDLSRPRVLSRMKGEKDLEWSFKNCTGNTRNSTQGADGVQCGASDLDGSRWKPTTNTSFSGILPECEVGEVILSLDARSLAARSDVYTTLFFSTVLRGRTKIITRRRTKRSVSFLCLSRSKHQSMRRCPALR